MGEPVLLRAPHETSRKGFFVALAAAALLVGGCATTHKAKPGDEARPPATAPQPKPAPEPKPAPKPRASPSEKGAPATIPEWVPSPRANAPRRTVDQTLTSLSGTAEVRIRTRFARAGADYPPEGVALLAFKQEGRVELWASDRGRRHLIESYQLLDDSGTLGPKLREGDEQIPEGIYRVTWLHPNSDYHLSMKLDYPNADDRARAKEDGRTRLGGDIFIHGGDVSIGCLAIGDPAIEELFVLAARVGIERVKVVVAPWDLRTRPAPSIAGKSLPWLPELYARLGRELAVYR